MSAKTAPKPWAPKYPAPADWPTLNDYQEARRRRMAAEAQPEPKKAGKR